MNSKDAKARLGKALDYFGRCRADGMEWTPEDFVNDLLAAMFEDELEEVYGEIEVLSSIASEC